jgi:hypothetical protein
VWRRIHAQNSYGVLAMPATAPPRSAVLPDDAATLKSLVREQAFEIERLKEQLRLARHKQFGASSETADAGQYQLFNEAEVLGAEAPAGEGDERGIAKAMPRADPRDREMADAFVSGYFNYACHEVPVCLGALLADRDCPVVTARSAGRGLQIHSKVGLNHFPTAR